MKNLSLKISMEINARAAKVWKALTDPQIVKQYFFGTKVKSDWKRDSTIIWEGNREGKTFQDKGLIKDVQPGKYLKFNYWSPMSGTEDRPENYASISYDLFEENGKTTLILTQDNLKSKESKAHPEQNWQPVFEKMKELVESGQV